MDSEHHRLKIWLYAIVRNEAPLIRFFLRHYESLVDRMIFYDGGSDDGTPEIIDTHSQAEVRKWRGGRGIVDDEFQQFANNQWKEARGQADWVIFVDADEFLHHSDWHMLLKFYLEHGVTLPRVVGYTMLHPTFPVDNGITPLTSIVRTGIEDGCWDKQAIFREDIHFNPGRHSVDVTKFTPVTSHALDYATGQHANPIRLLHYRGLGLDYVKARHARNWARVPERCRALNYGSNTNPAHSGHHDLNWFAEKLSQPLVDVI